MFIAQNEHDLSIIDQFGRPLLQNWKPLAVYIPERKKDRPSSDFPSFLPNAPIFGEKARGVYQELLQSYGEFLPLEVAEEGEYYLFNLIHTIEGLDEEHSDVLRFKSGRIMHIRQYSFYEEKIRDQILFQIPEDLGSIFVTDPFIQVYQVHGLTGLDFKEVWSTDL
jgi:hypothetical protein